MSESKRVALYFGSFDPIHNGHIHIATHLSTMAAIDEVWLVVSPQNPFKSHRQLTSEHHRIEMVRRATEPIPHLCSSDIELKLPRPSYTAHTLKHLQSTYPSHDFSILMGEDSLQSICLWREYEYILSYPLYVYPRTNMNVDTTHLPSDARVHLLSATLTDISSTKVRSRIVSSEDVDHLIPLVVQMYIEQNRLYVDS